MPAIRTPSSNPVPAHRNLFGWRTRLQQWFLLRQPRQDSMLLRQGNLYILPTRAGWLLLVTLLALLLASINYQINLGYLLTFLIAGCAVVSIPMSHNTLRGLQWHLRSPAPQYVGRPVLLNLHTQNKSNRRRLGIGLKLLDSVSLSSEKKIHMDDMIWFDCGAESEQAVQLAWHAPHRGWHNLPTIHIETRFPLGIFRVWSIWRTASQVLLYPEPETPAPPLPMQGSNTHWEDSTANNPFPANHYDDLPQDIRPYQRGDSPRYIVWKKAAQTGELISRESRQPDSRNLWLDFEMAAQLRDREAALSRLCAWIQLASMQDQPFGLHLPSTTNQPAVIIEPALGESHTQCCLQALAEWDLPRPEVTKPDDTHHQKVTAQMMRESS